MLVILVRPPCISQLLSQPWCAAVHFCVLCLSAVAVYQDPLAAAARLVIGLSIICTYPLVFMGLKEGFTDFAGLSGDTKTNFQVTCALLLVIMGLAFVIENVALVNSFVGAILGSFIIYIVPVLMFRGCAHLLPSGWTTTELALHKIIFAMGVVFGLGGCIIGILEETHPELFE